MKTKRFFLFGLSVLLLALGLTLVGCPNNSTDDPSGDSVWLADLQNPFVGHWESQIPSMDYARLVSEYKNDGTFTCDFPDHPEFGGPFAGGYSVTGDILIGWLDFEGASAYKFKAVDNDTIDVTEINGINEGGKLELGNTAPFVRVAGSAINKENKPLLINNVFIGGKWKSQIPSMDNAEMVSEYKADGTFTCGFPNIPGYEGPFNGAYLVFEDKMASWLDFEGAAAYKFEAVDANTINVTEIDEVKEGGELTLGHTAPFTFAFAGGQGTQEAPWSIETAAQLDKVRNRLDGYYILNADINLSSYANFEPIGTFVPASEAPEDAENPDPAFAFSGSLNGNGHKISNITINSDQFYGVGLFGCALGNGREAVIENINLENVTVAGYWIVGGLIGYQFEGCLVRNIHLSGNNTITGNNGLGGIIGGGVETIEHCSAVANIVVVGDQYGGGSAGILGGGLTGCMVKDCSAQGSITATAAADGPGCYALGGLVGSLGEGGELRDSNVSQVTISTGEGAVMIGGLLGYGGDFLDEDPNAVKTQIINCSVQQVAITAPNSASRIGGLLGGSFYLDMYAALHQTPSSFDAKDCTVQNSSISGGALVGSIAGYAYKSTIENCVGTVTGAANQTGKAEDTFTSF